MSESQQRGRLAQVIESLAPEVEQWAYDAKVPRDLAIEVEGSARDERSASFRVVAAGHTSMATSACGVCVSTIPKRPSRRSSITSHSRFRPA